MCLCISCSPLAADISYVLHCDHKYEAADQRLLGRIPAPAADSAFRPQDTALGRETKEKGCAFIRALMRSSESYFFAKMRKKNKTRHSVVKDGKVGKSLHSEKNKVKAKLLSTEGYSLP